MAKRAPRFVHQFLIVLTDTDPLVWRRIHVPQVGTFWDLHVAIQDAMGWQDTHLHEFRIAPAKGGPTHGIGIPNDEPMGPGDVSVLAGWTVPLDGYFDAPGTPASYLYDFGDAWRHIVTYEQTSEAGKSLTYPRCVAGARACPPEDCGGAHGYADFLLAMANPRHPQHRQLRQWQGGPFDPDVFDPAAVTFDDPRSRWEQAFGHRGSH